jgi:alpha-N-arabinofuranosidase
MGSFINKTVVLMLLATLSGCLKTIPKDAHITIYTSREIGQINRKVFGSNFLGYDPATYEDDRSEYYGYSDYGAGIWDPRHKRSVKEVVVLAKDSGVSIARFPGGCGVHHYNWKKAIGRNREHFLYGIDEFLETCEEIGAEAVITVSYFTGTEQDAADLVEYLLSPDDGSNPNGGIDWAKERSANGHSAPYYNVKYFEMDNETYHGDHRNIKTVSPEEYADRYLKYYEAMKSVEPQINIGVVLCPIYWDNWNRRVLNVVKDKVDFGIVHTYPVPEEGDLRLMGAKQIFEISLGIPVFGDEVNFQDILKLLKAESGRDIPLAITEYNGGFAQEKPVPYRHCLGTALINAELLRIFMKPEHKILMANYWQFCNSYWGMVKSQEDFMKHDYRYPIAYIKRPNYYVFELYNKHFGSELIMADVESGFYREKGFSIPYLTVNTSVNEDKSKIYLIVVNKNLDEPVCARIHLKDFVSSGGGDAWILNGPSIDATNEKNPNNVKVMHRKFEIRDNPFGFTFEPHSLIAIEITGRKDE